MPDGVQRNFAPTSGKATVDWSRLPPTPEALEKLRRFRDKVAAVKLSRTLEQTARFSQYMTDPIGFVERGTGGFLWTKQREICLSVRDNRRTAAQACHDVGKSAVAARIAAWWISSHAPGEAFVVSTAPTWRQVRTILWREIGRVARKTELPGRVNQTEWHLNDEIVAFGTSPADTDPTAFQGIHQRYVLVIIDEACGVAGPLWEAADSLIANEDSRILAIGNPDDPTSYFAKVCKPGSGWNLVQISAFDSPNFTGEEIPAYLKPLLVSRTWVEEKRKSWGETSPLWIAKVMGQFPEDADDGLIPYRALRAAVDRDLAPGEPSELGVDVARHGNDNTVGYHRRGPHARRLFKYNGRDTMQTVGYIMRALTDQKVRRVKIDDSGVGGGVTDRLKEMQGQGLMPQGVQIIPINVGSAPTTDSAAEHFFNLRAELHWGMRLTFLAGDIDIEDDDDVLAQASNIKYQLNSRGQIQIESKDDMKERGLPSPDDFEALMLAYAKPNVPGSGFLDLYAAELAAQAANRQG